MEEEIPKQNTYQRVSKLPCLSDSDSVWLMLTQM